MALPASYTQTINTVTTAALDAYTRNPANFVTTGSTVLLNEMAARGRIFPVNDCEKISHPLLYGTASVERYDPTIGSSTYRLDGTPNGNSLSVAAQDVLDKALFKMQAVTGNINFPQNDPEGDVINSAVARVKSFVGDVLEQEENMFLRGEATGTGTEALNTPWSADADYSEGTCMSMLGLLSTGIISSSDKFANVAVADQAQWKPTTQSATDVDGANLLTDLQKIMNAAGKYGGVERPTHVLTTQGAWEKFVDLHRAKSTINDQVIANMGVDGAVWVPYAGLRVGWSPFLSGDALWDFVATAETTATAPFVGLNLNSLRLNYAKGGGVTSGLPGQSTSMFAFLNDMQLVSDKTNYFRRVNAKYCWSVDAGRRSFFHLDLLTGSGLL